ncbi:MAG TPA: hypothetical protein VFQ53_02045 [Kofleriaceae bacterium]|nr:hypothetical protein [Kofleriaceae bacterium]
MMLVIAFARTAAADAKPDVTTRLHRYYGTRAGYGKVYRAVMAWHKTTENGCVAFASTALRHVGVAIPIDGKKDGQGVSRITRSFARYLAEDLGWTRIDDAGDLRPGDIVFTTDAPCCPGYPAHVMMFDGWIGRGHVKARVVDNQGFHVTRAMTRSEGSDVDGFGYALRPAAITGSSALAPAAARDSSHTPP